jgi:hypothetical protein
MFYTTLHIRAFTIQKNYDYDSSNSPPNYTFPLSHNLISSFLSPRRMSITLPFFAICKINVLD